MGLGPSKEEFEATKRKLQEAEQKNTALNSEKASLQQRLQAQAQVVEQQQSDLAQLAQKCEVDLEEKDAALAQAVKQQQLAEELRRSDALLAKRLLHAQLRHLGGGPTPEAGVVDGDAMAASLALAAQDEMQLRKMLMHTAGELESAQRRAHEMERTARGELARELWLPDLCDVSVTLRSAELLVLGGFRLPRVGRSGIRGTGISPGLAVMRQIGEPTAQGQWAAVGGSLLWDARNHELSSMRLALCAQPAANQHVSLSFDHRLDGLNSLDSFAGLTGSVKTTRDSISARLFGTLDLNRKGGSRAGLEVVYDMPGL
mmetsp:Transcript_26985/g.54268  ORF Transcript_26985/g.54268 Transcript_26985/m.54268 type:complete len:316 (-) Transcript_26985:626-1573(-)